VLLLSIFTFDFKLCRVVFRPNGRCRTEEGPHEHSDELAFVAH
jgi:hypothetical protein